MRSGIGRRLLWRYAPAALLYVILGSVLLEAARRIVLEGDAPPSPFSVVLLAVAILCPLIIFSTRQMVALAVSLEMAQLELLGVVSHAIAKRDDATEEHNFRVALMAAQLAGAIGLDRRLIPGLFVGALLHDVGKIGVPDNILLKPAGLSPEERREMELHVVHGDGILADANMPPGARGVVHYHHEHFDGSGYPEGRKGGEIPPEARLFAIVDVFDAMTSSRPYKQPMDLNEALEAMERGRGSHFDPAYFDIFAKIAGSLYAMVRNARVDDLQERILRLIENYYATLDPRRC
ncbi:MAG: Cyclic di-GMP phosphodiesterase response regulator RpfG [candidate division BRC1 bacterium ADurb.BinA364]|nr:MAG: Cyclic di-GMP phosphodiesterase response regulator RpfG [candidate division BRC1 bacterium ADurb.BinA364]